MKCPIDQSELVISDRQGVEIDYCPTCRGVWLDRGELDKVIDRTDAMSASSSSGRSEYQDNDYRGRDDDYGDDNGRQLGGQKKKKKASFLGELFDFG